jgi:outer membrane protein
MNKLGSILGIIAFIGMCILAALQLGNKNKTVRTPKVISSGDGNKAPVVAGSNCAFVDIDSLENNYKFFKQKKAEFEGRDKAIGNELEKMTKDLQSEYMVLQRKAQEGKLTEEEGKVAQDRLAQKQQDIEVKKQSLGSKLMKDQDEFNVEFKNNIKGFLTDYAAENGFDYVFMHSNEDSPVLLYVNEDNNITGDVIEALNTGKNYAKKKGGAKKETSTDSTKTK